MPMLYFPANLNNANPIYVNSTSITNVTATLVSATVSIALVLQSGTTLNYIVPAPANAMATANAILAVIAAAYGKQGMVTISPLPITFTSCTPSTFVATGGATATLDITGTGFYPAMQGGVINIEDVGGGYDSDGFTYSISYVDSNHLIATYLSDGNGVTGASFIYFTDINGIIQGELTGLTTS
jgi:hypothetical protein